MLKDYSPVTQALLGTLFTWGLTAAGAAVVVVIRGKQRKLLDVSLGFAAGVMVAASYWSLLSPAIEMASESKLYGAEGEYAFVPVAIGFLIGAAFVYGTDALITYLGIQSPNVLLAMQSVGTMNSNKRKQKAKRSAPNKSAAKTKGATAKSATKLPGDDVATVVAYRATRSKTKLKSDKEDIAAEVVVNAKASGTFKAESDRYDGFYEQNARRRQPANPIRNQESGEVMATYEDPGSEAKNDQWKRILLLVIAITVHNIPEGLAVGVAFGAVGSSASATFENARNLAVGIGIQNFPEGLAVSLPLQAAGFSTLKSFWYGQLSGMVEPLAGVLGAACVTLAAPVLPYALAFAAGAMIYVVIDDIIPEAHQSGNGKLASWGAIAGFLVMMSLDVGLG
ncbi:zinc transporter ZIP11 isoform X1 [Trichogramma pretiosum]|uniref:zinc transporter ZIP11 isoform X1 n=1 Tax=Trichogramma pretiosum TaxID=7493 RepID=UPI0006C97559|nr:zinc transporter ZIP11 isoform X1 [Trichogramma pretiosum]